LAIGGYGEKGTPEPAQVSGRVAGEKLTLVMSRPVYYVMVGQKISLGRRGEFPAPGGSGKWKVTRKV
jgi:hypothetical protein